MHPPRPFVDSHMHFWRREGGGLGNDGLGYAWLADVPELPDVAEPEVARQEAGDAFPDAVVFVEADCGAEQSVLEAEWVANLALDEPAIRGIVAAAPLERGAAALSTLDGLAAIPLVKGVRRLVQDEASGFAAVDDFVTGVHGLADRGLSFDLCIRAPQLEEAAALVEACPQTSFVLDHFGKPPIASGEIAGWRAGLSRIAACGNAVCKLSGLVTEADAASWTLDDLRPYVAHALSEFGADRLLFGSDWPVVRLASSYRGWLEAALELTESLSGEARSAVFGGNAQRVYRLGS